MAVKKMTSKTSSIALTAEGKKEIKRDIYDAFKRLPTKDKIELLGNLGVGFSDNKEDEKFYTCYMCGKIKKESNFFPTSVKKVKTGISPICNDCVENLLTPDVGGVRKPADKESIQETLYYLNKPFKEVEYHDILNKITNNETSKSLWWCYSMMLRKYLDQEFRNSDGYSFGKKKTTQKESEQVGAVGITEDFEKNKRDVLRMLGYLPFENEMQNDQPLLYAQLVSFLGDEMTLQNGMYLQSAVAIVRGFYQASKIDEEITNLIAHGLKSNVNVIKNLTASRQGIISSVTKLADDNCISSKNNKTRKKGEDTWTGKTKKIKELNLRAGEVNGFDINTCKAMRQVNDISVASILKQLALDESQQAFIIAEQLKKLTQANNERDAYAEINRILLRENVDLKDTLFEHGLIEKVDFTKLEDLYSIFAANTEQEREEAKEYAREIYEDEENKESVGENNE